MPRLHLVIVRPSRTGEPTVAYCGTDGAAALASLQSATQPFAEYFRNPRGIRKQVPGHAENAAAEQAAFDTEVAAEQANYNAAVQAKARELADAKIAELSAALAERDAELESLRTAKKPKAS